MTKLMIATVVLITTVSQGAAQYAQMPRPETQFYSPYSYQLQMDQYVRDQARQEFERQQRLNRSYSAPSYEYMPNVNPVRPRPTCPPEQTFCY